MDTTLTTGTDEAAVEALAGAMDIARTGDRHYAVIARTLVKSLGRNPAAARAVRDAIDPDGLRATAEEVQAVRRQAVHDTVRRLPSVVAVYQTTVASALALLMAEDAPLANAIAEDTWDGIKKNWPPLLEGTPDAD